MSWEIFYSLHFFLIQGLVYARLALTQYVVESNLELLILLFFTSQVLGLYVNYIIHAVLWIKHGFLVS